MEIIIPKNNNVKYAIINVLDAAKGEELNRTFDPSARWISPDAKNNYDNYLFLVLKEDLMPYYIRDLAPTHNRLKEMIVANKDQLLNLPCFREMSEMIKNAKRNGEFEKPETKRYPEFFTVIERLQNIKQSTGLHITSLNTTERDYTIYTPVSNGTMQTFDVRIRAIPYKAEKSIEVIPNEAKKITKSREEIMEK